MSEKKKHGVTVSGIFLQGVAITVPITLTAIVFYWLAAGAEDFLRGVIQSVFPSWKYWPGMGIVLAVVLIFVAGILMNIWITRYVLVRIDSVLERIPVVKSLYGGMRDIAFFLSKKDSGKGFQQVVAVKVTDDIRLVGFMTASNVADISLHFDTSEQLVAVYLPMSYQIGGYTVFVPPSLVEPLDMSVEDAMRLTLTAGISAKKPRTRKKAAKE